MRHGSDHVATDLSLWGMFGSCSFRRATSVCMNLLKGVSFFLPPAEPFSAQQRIRSTTRMRQNKHALLGTFFVASLCAVLVTIVAIRLHTWRDEFQTEQAEIRGKLTISSCRGGSGRDF